MSFRLDLVNEMALCYLQPPVKRLDKCVQECFYMCSLMCEFLFKQHWILFLDCEQMNNTLNICVCILFFNGLYF